MQTLRPRTRIRGELRVPGDKSISHRALIFAAIAEGRSRVHSLAPGEDVRSTRRCLERLGIVIEGEDGTTHVDGRGWSGIDAAGDVVELDCGNSGTTARLLIGLLSGRRGRYRIVGDASLSRRPMARVVAPLRAMGAKIEGADRLPIVVEGAALRASELDTGVASAQVKSALMLGALQADGESVVRETCRSRDHTERMLGAMGAPIEPADEERLAWRVSGAARPLRPIELQVPGDPSSAAPAVALAASLPGSELVVRGLCLNETRAGVYRLLARMGARVDWDVHTVGGEVVGSLQVGGGRLSGIAVEAPDVVAAIDELPLIACVGAVAEGVTEIRGAAELRAKESDRIRATVRLLDAFGARVEELEDGLRVRGGSQLTGASIDAAGDHRIAMCATFLAAHASGSSRLGGAEWIAVSYPDFFADLDGLEA